MTTRFGQTDKHKAIAAFTLVEVVMSIAILALVMGGMIQGYIQTNRRAEWSYMSLAAQSSASQAVEQAMAAKWFRGAIGELPPPQSYTRKNSMVVPTTDQPVIVTNYVWVTDVSPNPSIPLRQIRADCYWRFPLTGAWFTNTVITCRAPAQ